MGKKGRKAQEEYMQTMESISKLIEHGGQCLCEIWLEQKKLLGVPEHVGKNSLSVYLAKIHNNINGEEVRYIRTAEELRYGSISRIDIIGLVDGSRSLVPYKV